MTDQELLKVYDGYKFVILTILTAFLLSLFHNKSLFYKIVFTATTSIFTYFSRDKPVWVKVVWWGLYSYDIVNAVRQAMEVCEKCIADHKESYWSCRDGIFDLIHSLISIFITLAIGFHDYLSINCFINAHNLNSIGYYFYLFLLSVTVIYSFWIFIDEYRFF